MGKAGAAVRQRTPSDWSEWRPVAGFPPITPAVLAELLDGGQAFRWYPSGPETWIGAWASQVVRLRVTEGRLHGSAPSAAGASVAPSLAHYLALDGDFAEHVDALPWRSDSHLARCIGAFPGLRLLRQPFGETLLCFLCSATKQIVQIKQMVGLLAARHGPVIARFGLPAEDAAAVTACSRLGVVEGNVCRVHGLPTWDALAGLSEQALRDCLLGFRARYIAETAQFLAARPGWLEETERLPYATAKARLCELPGVGEKVADCVLLFGAGQLEAFPVDVWILKTMAQRYGLEGWKPAQLTQFGRVHFGPNAGLAQQFLFAWERAHARGRLT